MDRCDGSSNIVDNPFGRICVPNKTEDVNLRILNMIKGINKSTTPIKRVLCECRCQFDGRKCNSKQNRNNDKCQCEFKKPIRHLACEEDYAWNPNACECDKDCEIGEYLKYSECVKSP